MHGKLYCGVLTVAQHSQKLYKKDLEGCLHIFEKDLRLFPVEETSNSNESAHSKLQI